MTNFFAAISAPFYVFYEKLRGCFEVGNFDRLPSERKSLNGFDSWAYK